MFLASDAFGGFCVFFVIAGVVGLIIWGAQHQKKIRENWRQFGVKHRLNVTGSPSSPVIAGWMGPVYITLNTVVRGSGKNRSTYTQHHATINAPMPSGMQMYKEGFFSKVGKALGGQDVQIGDPTIDGAFIIKGNDLLGVHNLLRNPHLKKALLYCISRQPALQVNERALLIEHTGMTGDLAKIEAAFADLVYLAQTFDAAYQELAGPAVPQPRPAPPPQTSKAAAAEILGASFFPEPRTPEPQVRRAAPDEDPASRHAAMSEMAGVLNQYEGKLERGEARPQPAQDVLTNFARADSMEGKRSDAFEGNVDPQDIFAATASSNPLKGYDPAKSLKSRNDAGAFAETDNAGAFDDPKPFEAPAHETTTEGASSLDELVGMLSDSSLMSSDREAIIERNRGTEWPVEVMIERIENTWGFDIPDDMKDGKTIEGSAGERKFALRFSKARNNEVGNLRNGVKLKAKGKLAAWDDLFKKATLDVK